MNPKIGIIWSGKLGGLSDLDLEGVAVFEGIKMSESDKVAAKMAAEGIEAIICTAGTAAELRKNAVIPIIVAYTAYIDILETFKELESNFGVSDKKIVLILHESNPFRAERLFPFVNNRITFLKYHNEEHLCQIVHRVFEKNFDVLVGGPTAVSLAGQLGLRTHLVTSSKETMLGALHKAKEIVELIRKERVLTQRLKTVIDIFPEGIIATDNIGVITMCNPRTLRILNMSEQDVLGKKVHGVTGDQTWREVYQKGVRQNDILSEYKGSKIFSTRQPIMENGYVIGSIGTLQEATKIQKLEHKYRSMQVSGLTAKSTFDDIIGDSLLIKETLERAKAYAKYDLTVLLEGETGTGKEIFAQSLHNASPRKNGPFVAINCATLSETLLESELLGYEEGAFTGAKRGGKIGLFELSHKGTIFLDEINQIPLQLQAKVLRVIQEKVVLRLGGERVIPVDVRIIAATNENLKEKISAGKFRDDLFYRINVLNLHLPPLRRRQEDIPALIKHFLKIFSVQHGPVKCTPDELMRLVSGYEWPGNIRELANFVERFAVLKQNAETSSQNQFLEFGLEKQAVHMNDNDSLVLKMATLANMERQLIRQVVNRCGGNKSRAALLLDINRNTINNRINDD